MPKFAVLLGFVSTNAGGDFYPGVRREPRSWGHRSNGRDYLPESTLLLNCPQLIDVSAFNRNDAPDDA